MATTIRVSERAIWLLGVLLVGCSATTEIRPDVHQPVIADELARHLAAIPKDRKHGPLRERYDAYWSSLVHRTRFLRNDAGHPKTLQPISRADARMMLIVFPHIAELAKDLRVWIAKHM